LKKQWQDETWLYSDPFAICTHPAYQKIIGMGPAVLPMILKDLEVSHRQWFWALDAIVDEDPLPPDMNGNIKEQARIWVEWGYRKGLLP